MPDAARYTASWLRAVERFNQGDVIGFGEVLAEKVTFDTTNGGHVADTKAEILKFLAQGRDDGWVSHNPISIACAGEFLTGVFENRMADGTTNIGAGVGRFNEDGLLVEIRGFDPVEPPPS